MFTIILVSIWIYWVTPDEESSPFFAMFILLPSYLRLLFISLFHFLDFRLSCRSIQHEKDGLLCQFPIPYPLPFQIHRPFPSKMPFCISPRSAFTFQVHFLSSHDRNFPLQTLLDRRVLALYRIFPAGFRCIIRQSFL